MKTEYKEKYENMTCACNENILLDCKNGNDIGPLTNISGTKAATPISLGFITLDKSKLCNSTILLTFTGELSVTIDKKVNPRFILTRRNCNADDVVIEYFSINTPDGFANTESFAFQHCDHDFCDDCVTYSLTLITGVLDSTTNLSVKNVVISAKQINSSCC